MHRSGHRNGAHPRPNGPAAARACRCGRPGLARRRHHHDGKDEEGGPAQRPRRLGSKRRRHHHPALSASATGATDRAEIVTAHAPSARKSAAPQPDPPAPARPRPPAGRVRGVRRWPFAGTGLGRASAIPPAAGPGPPPQTPDSPRRHVRRPPLGSSPMCPTAGAALNYPCRQALPSRLHSAPLPTPSSRLGGQIARTAPAAHVRRRRPAAETRPSSTRPPPPAPLFGRGQGRGNGSRVSGGGGGFRV